MIRNKKLWIFAIPLIFFAAPLFAQHALNLTRDIKTIDVTPYLSFYEDKEDKLSIDEVTRQDAQGRLFKKRDSADFGVVAYTIWGKFEFKNESSQDWWFLFFKSERLAGAMDVYLVSGQKIIKSFHQNDWKSFYTRIVQHRNEIFPLGIPGKMQTIYFSLKPSSSTLEFDASLHTATSLIEKVYRDNLIMGIYYGIMIAMLVYNMFIFFAIREKAYFYYIAYLLVYIIAQSALDGLFIQFISPNHIDNWHHVIVFGAVIAWPCSILFTTSLLQVKNVYPGAYRFYQFMIAMFFVPSILYPFVEFQNAIVMTGFCIIIVTLFSFAVSFLLSFQSMIARYYFGATLIFILGMLIQEIKLFNIYFPVISQSNYSVQIGSALEALLFSLALGYRINVMRQSGIAQEIKIKKLEYSSLQGKVNPHFLYNSLNMILGMLQSDKNAAEQTVVELAKIYEYMTYHVEKDLVPIKEEWQFARKYFQIMNKRTGQKDRLVEDFPKNAQNFPVPPLSLQPLIENCLKHAKPKNVAKDKKEKYIFTISMSVKMTNEGAIILVSDNGEPSEMYTRPQGALENIRQRLEHYYSNVEVSIHPVKTGGTKVEICISGRKN
ncbi:MAG: histidine kinase [Spirochaetia bacterium]|nr:histidine kinase [Spirochaetia bacterium]